MRETVNKKLIFHLLETKFISSGDGVFVNLL
jgi:hypothetical protein